MSIDPYIVLASAVVGFLVGMTGAGGGALMTPMLILLFGIKPSTAISSDLVAAVLMRPVGAVVHMTKRTVNYRLVGWMVLGSVPMAFVGAWLLKQLGHTKSSQTHIEVVLGANQLVGTDLTQAVPLTVAAALGALAFGHVEFGLTLSIVVGSVPAVLAGSLISSRAPDRYIRPVITFVIFASGLKYVGLGTTALGWTLAAVLVGAGAYWLAYLRPRRAALRLRALDTESFERDLHLEGASPPS